MIIDSAIPQDVPNFFKSEEAPTDSIAGEIAGEKAPEASENESEKQERLSEQYAKLARQRAQARRKSQEAKAPLKEKESEVETLKKELERLKRYEDINDPMELLKEKGFSYEDLIAKNLNPEGFEAKNYMSKMEEKLAAAEKKIEDYLTKQEEDKKQAEQAKEAQTVEQYIKHVEKFVSDQGDKYELIKEFGHHKDVYEVIALTYERTGKLIEESEACDMVESHLEKNLDRYAKLNKLKSRLNLTSPEKRDEPLPFEPVKPVTHNTLTNQLTPQTTATPKRKLTEDELIAQAAGFLKWNNN